MEDTLRAGISMSRIKALCLNPCFNGRYSQRYYREFDEEWCKGLNPCFNGRYSQSHLREPLIRQLVVLILVLMEDTLRVRMLTVCKSMLDVLILVLMEDTLRDTIHFINN